MTAFLTGCGGGGSSVSHSTSTGQYGALRLSLTAQSDHGSGEKVPMTFTIQNTGTQTVQALIGQVDATVSQDGQAVWQYSKATGTVEGYTLVPIAAGQSRSYSLEWDQKNQQDQSVPRGTYTVTCWVQASSIDGATVPSQQLAAAPLNIAVK